MNPLVIGVVFTHGGVSPMTGDLISAVDLLQDLFVLLIVLLLL
jgi:hypothetical protein